MYIDRATVDCRLLCSLMTHCRTSLEEGLDVLSVNDDDDDETLAV